MLRRSRWRVPAGIGVLTSAVALSVPAFAAPALAAGAGQSAASPAATGPVSRTPASGTPYLALTKTQQTIKKLVKCGNTMYAVGRVWNVQQNGRTYVRHNVFSFSATAPYTMTGWSPNVDGQVNSITFSYTPGHGCGTAYLGGDFKHVDGKNATNIAAVSTSTGALNSTFERYTNSTVDTLAAYKSQLLVGGTFTRTNGYSRYFFESLSPNTGKVTGFVNLHVEGQVFGNARQIYNQQISHSGSLDLVEGNFTSVAGQPRQQIFMLNLSGTTAKVTGWTSGDLSKDCISKEAFYVRSAAWSPSDSTVYVADTGDHPINWSKGQFPLWGMCDAVAAFPATQTSVNRSWIEYSGCDSYYSVAADDSAVYAGGHPRWADNPNGCNAAGSGAVADRGMQGLNPANGAAMTTGGQPTYNSSRDNADDMLITSAGLWVASTNRFNSNTCDGVSNHSGICLLPYS